MKKKDNPIRLKVTGKCNKNCPFCHQEGGMDIDEMEGSKINAAIKRLSIDFNTNAIALTGGEPLLHKDLCNMVESAIKDTNITNVYLVTNGTIKKDKKFWIELQKLGLKKVNISVPDVSKDFEHNIKILNDLGIHIDINVVVYNGLKHTKEVVDSMLALNKKYNFTINLLPDLEYKKFRNSQKTLEQLVNEMGFVKVQINTFKGISNTTNQWVNNDGIIIETKSTLNSSNGVFKLADLCNKCNMKNKCTEGFYGIRMEQVKDKIFVRLCLHKSTDDVLFPYNKFLESKLYNNLMTLWK